MEALRCWMSLLCLVLATSDPLLRHWEAATDLALSFAELRQGDDLNNIEPVDDGVADDPGSAILKAGSVFSVADSWGLLAVADSLTTHFVLTSMPPGLSLRFRVDRRSRSPAGTSRRHAWLQRYLI
ncbi:hypothetical protein Sinac_4367 [Singulisphaera acidiphila DSM 18658]|uniref:Uncharacterized protein n=1 Tax=Singulisphaera acidiphila (strain ATCC BAA-1392 / DSM 18658 / VKM B-2454 / MOB10) TaxID=886293 RepID=L0DIC1_SINAD|nr:hypothetical protein Sinac_4367 [Singulisphaera acidiphila DSM 18658]